MGPRSVLVSGDVNPSGSGANFRTPYILFYAAADLAKFTTQQGANWVLLRLAPIMPLCGHRTV